MLIGEAEDLLDRKLFGLRCRYIGWMSRSTVAANWTVYSTGHNLLTVFGNPKWAFRFQRHLTQLMCHPQSASSPDSQIRQPDPHSQVRLGASMHA